MNQKILLLEEQGSVLSVFKALAPPELEVVSLSPADGLKVSRETGVKYSAVFVNVSSVCPELSRLAPTLHAISKNLSPTIRLYGYAYSTESQEILSNWGFNLLRPMYRDFKVDVEQALKHLKMTHLRKIECETVRSDCDSCRYNDCKGVIKGSELKDILP